MGYEHATVHQCMILSSIHV